ncbi:MAG: DNA alkylation repair protein [Nitrospinae bacterium]|nr:DNA alkylation repair protein [Nitrospinota bacterium]MBL7019406.1 DNA alkylation repair protein [Nitrospinaceae bacterium]
MPEPFKNLLNRIMIRGMAEHFSKAEPDFDSAGFVMMAGENLETLELKERSTQITATLATFLPDNFEKAAAIMLASLAPEECDAVVNAQPGTLQADQRGIEGWAIMPMVDYVGLYGRGHFDLSMALLKEMTKRFSSEFGIRFFLIEEPERTLSLLKEWARDSNHHVRRLISEGTRPRLPWAMRLPAFIEDPTPLLPLLEALKDDDEEYVRRSVANNLNDIAKDHPDLIAEIAKRWLNEASKDRKKLVRHACRTLIKQGHQKTLKALGYDSPCIKLKNLEILTPSVSFGNAVIFELCLTSTSKHAQPLIIDYAIHHRKANGSATPKVFKWKTITLAPLTTMPKAKKKHAIKKITTRTYYPGTQGLEVLINGVSFGVKTFELVM